MWRFLLIFLLTAVIVQFVFRDKEAVKAKRQKKREAKRESAHKNETVPSVKRKPRGEIIEPNEFISGYGLVYSDVSEVDSDYEYLASQGYQGGGPSWVGIIYGVLKIKDQTLLQRIEFDDEGDGVMINGESREDMEKIAFWIDEVKADRKLMQRAIMMANIDGQME